jgi:hypothetical protein
MHRHRHTEWGQREGEKRMRTHGGYVPVVGAPTGGVDKAAGDARDEELVGDLQLGYRV